MSKVCQIGDNQQANYNFLCKIAERMLEYEKRMYNYQWQSTPETQRASVRFDTQSQIVSDFMMKASSPSFEQEFVAPPEFFWIFENIIVTPFIRVDPTMDSSYTPVFDTRPAFHVPWEVYREKLLHLWSVTDLILSS